MEKHLIIIEDDLMQTEDIELFLDILTKGMKLKKVHYLAAFSGPESVQQLCEALEIPQPIRTKEFRK